MNYVWKDRLDRSFIHCSEEYHAMVISRSISDICDFIMSCPLYLLPFSLFISCILLLFFIVSFYSCCSHAQVFGTALVLEFGVFCRGAGCNLLLLGASALACTDASTIKIKLYNYYFCDYVICRIFLVSNFHFHFNYRK